MAVTSSESLGERRTPCGGRAVLHSRGTWRPSGVLLDLTAKLTAKPMDVHGRSWTVMESKTGVTCASGQRWTSVDKARRTHNPSVGGSSPPRPTSVPQVRARLGVTMGERKELSPEVAPHLPRVLHANSTLEGIGDSVEVGLEEVPVDRQRERRGGMAED